MGRRNWLGTRHHALESGLLVPASSPLGPLPTDPSASSPATRQGQRKRGQSARSRAKPALAVSQQDTPGAPTASGADEQRLPAPSALYFMDSAREGNRLEAKTDHALAERQLRWAGLQPGMRALDVGCGTGAVARVMASIAGPGLVTAFDASAARLEQGRQLAERDGLSLDFVRGDVLALPFAGATFDLTWARFLFEYLAQPRQALAEMIRVTRPGGAVVVADLDGQLDQLYPLDDAVTLDLREGLRLLEETGFDRHVGRKLHYWLYAAGLRDIAIEVEPYQVYTGHLPERDQQNWTEKLSTATARLGTLTGDHARWDTFRADYLAHLHRPGGFYYSTLVLARGIVPTP